MRDCPFLHHKKVGIGIKLDTLNYHDVKVCISFLNDDTVVPRVMALDDLENPIQYRVYGFRARILGHLTRNWNTI